MNYNQEAAGPTLSGVVTVGSVAGYEGGRNFSLAETQDLLDKINSDFEGSIWPSIPSMVREEHLVGRAGGSGYREKIYRMTFSWSPRIIVNCDECVTLSLFIELPPSTQFTIR